MSLDDERAESSLGERLLEGVLNLWKEVNSLNKVSDHHGLEIETIKQRMKALEREVHGLRVSRGRAKAKNTRLEASLVKSENMLSEIKSVIN
jgi:predicted  nucleic acid-binding Zn-ribbon protein